MNKIYLISPYCEREFKYPQISLEYIRYYLKDSGYDAEFINCSHYPKDLNYVISRLKEDEKPIIGVTTYTRERFSAYDLIRRIRNEIPDSLIVVGGHHFGFLPEETLKELPEVDIVVRGEGELTFKEICDSVYSNKQYYEILGISYKKGDEIIHNPDGPLEMNLDKFRCFDINDIPDFKKYSLIFPTKMDIRHYFTVYCTRGCPNRCVFCSQTAERVRFRSIDNIIKEIKDKIAITGVRNVSFGDPSLTNNRKFIEELCERIIERKLNIKWNCYSRVSIELDILELMKKAGMVSVEIGLESGSPRVLKIIKKNITIEQFEKFCKMAYSLGIKVYVFCMIGLPDETLEDVNMTFSLIRKNAVYINYVGLQTTRILPDSALYQMAIDKHLLPKDFNWFKPYIKDYKGVTSSYYNNIPLYLDRLTLEGIRKKNKEFQRINNLNFCSLYLVYKKVKENLGMDALKMLSFRKLRWKLSIAITLIKGLYITYIKKKK